jgi:DNA-binding NtrC family response regulator
LLDIYSLLHRWLFNNQGDEIMQPLILVVDDDPILRLLVAEMIKKAGYATLTAARASDALLLLERNPAITLLFTDIVMPGINGFVLADMAVERWPLLRVIYASGLANLRDAGQQPGRHHGLFLAKPFCSAQLTAAISETLSRPLLSGEAMWHAGMASAGANRPLRLARWVAEPL